MYSPCTLLQTLIDGAQKIFDQVPCVKSCPVPNDENSLGEGVPFFQKPLQKLYCVFHVRPVVLLQMKFAAVQIQGTVKRLALPFVQHRNRHAVPFSSPNISCGVSVFQMALVFKKNYRFASFDRFSFFLKFFFNSIRRCCTFCSSRLGFCFWLLCQLIPASCSKL